MSVADELATTVAERRSLEELRAASGEADGVMERHCVRCFLLSEALAGDRSRAPRDGFYRGLMSVVWPVLRSRPLTLPRVFKT